MPGLYFKYDVSALKVIVKPDQESFMHFLIRISSVIAGIIVISGMIAINSTEISTESLIIMNGATHIYRFFSQFQDI